MEPTMTLDRLYEDTFNLLRRLDKTDDPVEVAALQAVLASRAEVLDPLAGFALRAVGSKDLLVACLEEEQAKAIQLRLLTTPNGYMTEVEPVMALIEDFVHPDTDPTEVAEELAQD